MEIYIKSQSTTNSQITVQTDQETSSLWYQSMYEIFGDEAFSQTSQSAELCVLYEKICKVTGMNKVPSIRHQNQNPIRSQMSGVEADQQALGESNNMRAVQLPQQDMDETRLEAMDFWNHGSAGKKSLSVSQISTILRDSTSDSKISPQEMEAHEEAIEVSPLQATVNADSIYELLTVYADGIKS